MPTLTGGCACGALRYTLTDQPGFSFHCQCRACQHASGGGHASLFVIPAAAVKVTGEIKYYTQSADDGAQVSRGFCPHCGSPVLGNTSGHPDKLLIAAASLDDPSQFKPETVLFRESAQPWDSL